MMTAVNNWVLRRTARPVSETAKDALQYGSRRVTVQVSSLQKNQMRNVWVDGEVANYFRETMTKLKSVLGEVRALRLAGHNTMFPDLVLVERSANTSRMAPHVVQTKLKYGHSVLPMLKPPQERERRF